MTTDTVQTELGLYHGEKCAFNGRPILGSVADRESRMGIALGHEWCCCDPSGDGAQAHRDFLRREAVRAVLSQTKVWYDRGGQEVRLRSMSLRYKRNVLAFLERRAPGLKRRAEMRLVSFAATLGGEHAIDAADAELDRLMRQPVGEWFEEQPLIRSLRKRIAKGQDGPID